MVVVYFIPVFLDFLVCSSFQSETALSKQAFAKQYIDREGRFKTNSAAYGNGEGYVHGASGFDGHTQTAYANAIYMQMLTPASGIKAGNFLTELIHDN